MSIRYRELAGVVKGSASSMVAEASKLFAEDFARDSDENKKFLEKYGVNFKEDITTTTASGAYTTGLLEDALFQSGIRNIQSILGLVQVNDFLKTAGTGAIQVPIEQNATAAIVGEGSSVTNYNEGITSVTATPEKRVAATKITWEMLHRGMNGFMQIILNQASVAVERKLGSDIVNGLAVGAAAGNAVAGAVTYDKVVQAQQNVNGAVDSNSVPFGFQADKLVLNSTGMANLRQDTDYKAHVSYAITLPGGVQADRPVEMFHGMEIIETPLLTNNEAIVLDSRQAGILVKESDLELIEVNLTNSPDRQIMAVMSYVLVIAHSQAIATIN